MHGQGNYASQVGQGPYAPPPAFQQRPAAAPPPPPPTSLHGPPGPQPQVIQQVHPSFRPTPGIFAYQHAPPGVPCQGPPASVSSTQSYSSHPHPPQVHASTPVSHSYPNSELQRPPWGQNVRQLPPTAPHPGPSAYPLPSSQGSTLGRGQFHQPPPHALPGPPPPHSSSSSFLTSDPFGSSSLSMRHHSYTQQAGPLQPPPPPPPPPPPSSLPEVPPLPPSLPPSDFLSKNDGSCSSKDLPDAVNLMLEHPSPAKPVEDGIVNQIKVPSQLTEMTGPKVASTDALVAISPADSDMDMEDDITHPEEENKHSVPNNLKDECIPISQEDYMTEQPQALQHTGGHESPKVVRYGNPLSPEASVSKDQRGGSELVSDSCFLVTGKVSSGTDDSGMAESGQIEHHLDVTVKQSSSQHKNFSEPSLPETGYEKLSGQQMEGANPFKLLQGYASDNTSENDGGRLGDVSRPSINDGSTNFNAEKGRNLASEPEMKPSSANEKVVEFFDKTHGGQESVSVDNSVSHQPKDSSGNYDANIGLGGANFHKPDVKSNSTKLNVDEFGRLVREGVSDSETSDSSHYTWRHARRARKRSRSKSRSRSPRDRRRRSACRRRERHGRSRSSSPKRRRSRSRSPLFRRQSGFSGDKLRREKGQLQECFDFLRGKCYRGATCRYSHHESGKSERLRYNRGKQQYRDTSPALLGHDSHEESKFLRGKEVKDMGLRLPPGMPNLREGKDAKELPVDSTTQSPDKLNSLKSGSLLVADGVASNLSGYSAHDMTSRKESSFFSESPAKYSDKIPQSVDQHSKRIEVRASAASSAHLPADKSDATQGPTIQMSSVGSLTTKPYSAGVPSQSVEQFPPSIGNHPSQLAPPFPSVSPLNSAPFAQPRNQYYNSMPATARLHSTSENYSSYQAPVAYRHSHFPGPSNSLSSSFVLPADPSYGHLSMNVTTGECGIPSQHMQQPLLPPRDGVPSCASMRVQPTELPNQSQTGQNHSYPSDRESDQMEHISNSFGSSSLHASNIMSRRGDPRIMREDRLGHPVQGLHPVQSFAQAQPDSILQSLPKEMHSSLGGGGLPSDSTSSHGRPCFQQASYGLQHSGAFGVSAQLAEPGKLSSSTSRITPDFSENNHPYLRDSISNHFNPYASTFDLPLSSKFSSNALIQENDTTIHTKYGAPVGFSSVSVDTEKNGGTGSKKSSHPGLPAESVVPRPGGDQYDPLFDSIEPASNSFSRADHEKHETTGDSDNMMRFSGSGRVLDMIGTKHEGGAAASTNNSLENEEYGETADAEVGAVLNASSSNPDDATDMNAGEIEIDQVKASGKKKSKDSRSMKLFKVSIATFVKEVLKPSWRQGNMSKEAFKTIVKKTVDKVSGAMKGHHVPKSQAKINHYIDSSRGKLTKLVMGYVDKYVKV